MRSGTGRDTPVVACNFFRVFWISEGGPQDDRSASLAASGRRAGFRIAAELDLGVGGLCRGKGLATDEDVGDVRITALDPAQVFLLAVPEAATVAVIAPDYFTAGKGRRRRNDRVRGAGDEAGREQSARRVVRAH